MRPAHTSHQNSHRSAATLDGIEEQSLTLEQTFTRTSSNNNKSTFEKGSSFYSHNGASRRRSSTSSRLSSSNTSYRTGGGRSHNRFDHSLSYTSHNNELDIVGEEFDMPMPSRPATYKTPSGSHFVIKEDGQAIPTDRYYPQPQQHHRGSPSFFGRNDPIMEERPFYNHQQHASPQRRRHSAGNLTNPKSPSPVNHQLYVPPLAKMEPQHVDVSAPSRRCLQKQPAPSILVVGTCPADGARKQCGEVTIKCQSCRTPLFAPKTAIVVRCPLCRTVTSEAVCVSFES
jgi:LSD1 subclass zinc finger protein